MYFFSLTRVTKPSTADELMWCSEICLVFQKVHRQREFAVHFFLKDLNIYLSETEASFLVDTQIQFVKRFQWKLKDNDTWGPSRGNKWLIEWRTNQEMLLFRANKMAANYSLLTHQPDNDAAGQRSAFSGSWGQGHIQDVCIKTHRRQP